MNNQELNLENITEMANFYQENCYGDLSRLHPAQKAETEQAYLAGFYEALQFAKQLPPAGLELAEKELREWFEMRIKSLLASRGVLQ